MEFVIFLEVKEEGEISIGFRFGNFEGFFYIMGWD